MARRELQEINAGSMADIAFLLLIFWLVTTTIDSDEGIKRQLPPPVPPDIDVPQAKEQNVFNVKVNFLDQLLVEGEPLDLDQLKDKAKNFLIATGDGVMSHTLGAKTIARNREVEMVTGANGKTNAAFPEREWVRKADVKQRIAEYEQFVAAADTDKKRDAFGKVLDGWREADHHRIARWRLQAAPVVGPDLHAERQQHDVQHLLAGSKRTAIGGE